MNKISAAIITYNEEKNIDRCLSSVKGIADEIIVVDSFSTDKTKEICLSHGILFYEHAFQGHIQQKNYAISKTSNDYVLSLDADEVISPALKASILELKNNLMYDAFSFNRLTNYCGKWIHHCGWYPDTKVRLFNKNKGRWGGINPHDKIIMDEGATALPLKGDLLHYSYDTISSHIIQIEKFSNIAAQEAFEKGQKPKFILTLSLYPFFIFVKKYFFQRGFLDGYYGFIISSISAFGKMMKYVKLNELHRKNSKR